jgi:hypothetical protein
VTAGEVMERVRECGGRFEFRDGALTVVPPADPYWAKQLRELVPRLAAVKADILAALEGDNREEAREHAGRVCPECDATLFYDDPAEAERMCYLRAKRWGDGRSGYCPNKPAVGRS